MLQWLDMYVGAREEGQGLVEYALIIVLVSIVSLAILGNLGTTVSGVFNSAKTALTP